ncbi:hypothetical protein LTR37_018154 [Vermiconidia calcicola]|uniref:Uncharacterized protein n=1 Tax=Vermiconidia calcicola TaxID=1690605 RepID=A0ACC3MJM4_9PEZI|nr:hypothetical protein LTR37_018154 [Vermiconidia calcicola]
MPTTKGLRMAALGSSFAAGPSIDPVENAAAGRSSSNYAHLLVQKLNNAGAGAELTDLTVSGATLLDVVSEKQHAGGAVFEPQVQGLRGDEDIVTLTCGGNDIRYVGGLIDASMISCVGSKHPMTINIRNYPKPPTMTQKELTARLVEALEAIHRRAPKAKIYLVQYLSIIGHDTRPLYDIALTAESMKHFDGVAGLLAQAYVDAAESFNRDIRSTAEVVPIASTSKAHGRGSQDPWVRRVSMEMLAHGPAPFHPNAAGHEAAAEMLYRQIRDARVGVLFGVYLTMDVYTGQCTL